MLMLLHYRINPNLALALAVLLKGGTVGAHGGHGHHHHDHDHDHRPHNLRRNLAPGLSSGPSNGSNGHCNDGEPEFTVGGVTYECEGDFNSRGGQCHTPDQTPEQAAKADADFESWLERKKNKNGGQGQGQGRRLGGCPGEDCVDWDGQTVTVPVHFHVFHNGADGIEYTCRGDYASGFSPPYGGASCQFVIDQIRVLNDGFAGVWMDRDYPMKTHNTDTKIQFCLASSNNLFDDSAYDDRKSYNDRGGYKSAFRVGGMESFNVWVNLAGGYLGYTQFPTDNFSTSDGVVLLNDSMPNGNIQLYNLGDTLTHEVGHWLGLYHTFQGGCSSSTGDYQSLVGGTNTRESSATYYCPWSADPGAYPDTCSNDGGSDPIHNFMAYTQDSCMDEFTPGQAKRMQFAWEEYRHGPDSFLWSVGPDGYSCVQGTPETLGPTKKPTDSPTVGPTTTAKPTFTAKPTDDPTKGPTGAPTKDFGEVAWNFEGATYDGWTKASGTFDPDASAQGQAALKSSGEANIDVNGQCDRIKSPTVRLTGASTLSMRTYFDIEPRSQGRWFDRANVALYDGTTRRVVAPDGGARLYTFVSGRVDGIFGCSVAGNEGLGTIGWAGSQTTWAESTWSPAALGLGLGAGEVAEVQIDVFYATDQDLAGNGFWFDNVVVTNAGLA